MKIVNNLFVLILALSFTVTASAQQGTGKKKTKNYKDAPISKVEFQRAVKDYVKSQEKGNNGYFVLSDDKQEKDLKLQLMKVNNEELTYLGNDTYFVCSTFRGRDGKVYDLDIFMKGTDAENLEPVEVNIHKVDGVERYKWREVTIWEKEEIKEEKISGKKAKEEKVKANSRTPEATPQQFDGKVEKVIQHPAKRSELE